MKVLLYIALSYLSFSQVLSMSVSQTGGNNIPKEIFNSNGVNFYNHMEHKTELMDLNDDCQLLVLKHLDLVSLLSLTETNNYFKSLVAETVKKMFRKHIEFDLRRSSDIIDPPSVIMFDDYITIENVTIAEKVLNNYGHLIQRLQITEQFGNFKMNNVVRSFYKLVNSQCYKTLKEITLQKSEKYFLDEFTNPFENVQKVDILYGFKANRRLNEVFPSVRRLNFFNTEIFSTDTIYENLDDLSICVYNHADNGAAELIRKNPHIRSLKLELASPELIKIAGDSLPILEKLKLKDIYGTFNNGSIMFANVKVFETERCDTYSLFQNIKFGNVEEFYTDELEKNLFEENGFFESNKKLKNVKLERKYTGMYLSNDEIKKLAYAIPTLQDITIFACGFDSTSILELIQNCKQLKRLLIEVDSKIDVDAISKNVPKTFKDVWSIKKLDPYTVVVWKDI